MALSAPTQLPNGNWSYTGAGGTTTGTKDAVQSAYQSELGAQPSAAPASSQGSTPAVGRYPSGYQPPSSVPGQTPTPQSATDKAETAYMSATAPEDPSAITSRIHSEYQAEIDAIKQYYNGVLASQQVAGQELAGKTRATAAASGELGQDIGTAQQYSAGETEVAAEQSIAEAAAKDVGAVTSKEAAAIEGEIQGQKSTYQGALGKAVTYAGQRASTAQAQLSTIAGSYALNDLPQNLYDSLYEASGFSTPQQFNTYYNAARVAAQTGGKTLGDAKTGVYQQQLDGTWKKIIPGSDNSIVGDPTSGLYSRQEDGSYKQVIAPQLKAAAGVGIYNPTTGEIVHATPKIVSSGGVIYSVDPTTNRAIQLTANKTGWTATGGAADQEKAAIMSYLTSLGTTIDYNATLKKIQSDPTTYYNALGSASQSGYFTPINLGAAGTNQADAAAQAAQEAADAAANAQPTDTSS
ncbi:MAG: hypothetical protein KGI03_00985 [Patescibacteria group bacterium]|nr:hypothetical protein [Patescibacteria group bacterium]